MNKGQRTYTMGKVNKEWYFQPSSAVELTEEEYNTIKGFKDIQILNKTNKKIEEENKISIKELKIEADNLGIKYQSNIDYNALSKKIEEAKIATTAEPTHKPADNNANVGDIQ